MSDPKFVQPLSGAEIRADLVKKIEKHLAGSCDLRTTDAYPRGYSATFSYTINCYGLDSPTIKGEITAGTARPNDPETVTVRGDSEVPVEPELNQVRQRSEQDVPVLARTADGGEIVQKRRYSKRVTAPQGPNEGIPQGGSVDFQE